MDHTVVTVIHDPFGHACDVQVRQDHGDDHLVLAVRGVLSSPSVDGAIGRVLETHLLDRGRVVVDLSGADVPQDVAVGLFPAALAGAGGWPQARLVLARADAPTTRILRAARVHLTVPVATTLDEARALLDVRPARVARDHALPYDPVAPALARACVASACEEWGLDGDAHDAATTVVTELVENAVVHAGSECVLHLEVDRRCLQIAVRDRGPTGPGRPPVGVALDRGYGLLMVEGLSRGWGVTPHADGTTVWAMLDVEDPLVRAAAPSPRALQR